MLTSRRWRWFVVVVVFAGALVLGLLSLYPSPEALKNLNDISELTTSFNRDSGIPRVVLLLSPT